MRYIIRKINWRKKDKAGIPYDFLDIMKYFNKNLKAGKYPYVPRKNSPLTKKEILRIWVPNKKENVGLVCEDAKNKKIVAAANIALDTGIMTITKDLDCKEKGIGIKLTKKIIKEGLKRKIKVIVRTSIFNIPMIKIMKKLGYGNGKLIENFEVYRGKIEKSNYDVFEWIIKSS